MKPVLDPNYYPPNYVPKQGEDATTLVNNLVALPTKIMEESKGEETKEENKGEDTQEEEDRRKDKGDMMQTEDSGQEADDDDY